MKQGEMFPAPTYCYGDITLVLEFLVLPQGNDLPLFHNYGRKLRNKDTCLVESKESLFMINFVVVSNLFDNTQQ